MASRESGLQRAAHLAAVLTAVVAIFALWDTARMTRLSTESQTRAAAVSVLQDYMRLAIEHPDLANRADNSPVDNRYEWFAAHAYFTAETIYGLMHGHPEWDSTVASIVRDHHAFVRDGGFPCVDYSEAFQQFVKHQLKDEYKCTPP